MKDWKAGLDRYLTQGPPDDGMDDWCEELESKLSSEFYNKNEDWITYCDTQCNKWMNKLFNKDKSPEEAAKIIERAHKLYKL